MRRLAPALAFVALLALLPLVGRRARPAASSGAATNYLPVTLLYPTPTPDPLTPPVVSNPSYEVVAARYPDCPNDVALLFLNQDYEDVNGNVTEESAIVTVSIIGFNVSRDYRGNDVQVLGDGFSGTVRAAVCLGFGQYDELTLGLELTDATGLKSNQVTMVVQRPSGAPLSALADGEPSPSLAAPSQPVSFQ